MKILTPPTDSLPQSYLLLVLLGILLCLSEAQVVLPSVHGYYVADLYSNAVISAMSDQWSVIGITTLATPKSYTCGTTIFLGGLGTLATDGYYERTYSQLPVHNVIYYSIKLLIVDNWQASDYFTIQIDSMPASYWSPLTGKTAYPTYYCGDATKTDLFDTFLGKSYHTNTSLTLRITPKVFTSSSLAALGIREISILFRNSTSFVSESKCTKYSNYSLPGNCDSVTCLTGNYRDPTTSVCTLCHTNCIDCYGPSNSECYSCKSGFYYDGTSCVASPDVNCLYYSQATGKCSICTSTYYLYWDSICRSSCTGPNVIESRADYLRCKTQCESTNQFLRWDNTCTSSCDFPMTQRFEGSAKFCDNSCPPPNYFYPDGSCLPYCFNTIRTEGGYQFCDLCPLGYFQVTTSAERLNHYSEKQLICRTSCQYPYTVDKNLYCIIDMPQDYIKPSALAGSTQDWTINLIIVIAIFAAFLNFKDPRAICLSSMAQMITYLKYMRMNYPPRVQFILDHPQVNNLLKEAMTVPTSFYESFSYYQLTEKFEKYQLYSSFVMNFWPDIIILGSAALLSGIALLVYIFTPKNNIMGAIARKFKAATGFNFLIAIFLVSIGNIAFFTSLEVRTVHFSSFAQIFSFFMSLIMNIVVILVLTGIGFVIRKLGLSKVQTQTENAEANLRDRLQGFQIIFYSFKSESQMQRSFLIFYAVRFYLVSATIAYLFDYPLVQSILIFLLSLFMFLYLVFSQPCKGAVDLGGYIGQEFAFLLVSLSLFILAVLDARDIGAFDSRAVLGDIIIVSTVGFGLLGLIYLAAQVFSGIFDMYQFVMDYYKKDIKPQTKEGETSIDKFNLEQSSLDKNGHDFSSPQLGPLDTSADAPGQNHNDSAMLVQTQFPETRNNKKNVKFDPVDLDGEMTQPAQGTLPDERKPQTSNLPVIIVTSHDDTPPLPNNDDVLSVRIIERSLPSSIPAPYIASVSRKEEGDVIAGHRLERPLRMARSTGRANSLDEDIGSANRKNGLPPRKGVGKNKISPGYQRAEGEVSRSKHWINEH